MKMDKDCLCYPSTPKHSNQSIVFQLVCTTCLSKERNLFGLDVHLRSLMNVLGIKESQKIIKHQRDYRTNFTAIPVTIIITLLLGCFIFLHYLRTDDGSGDQTCKISAIHDKVTVTYILAKAIHGGYILYIFIVLINCSQKVCWECRAMIIHIMRFKHTAAEAQSILLRQDWTAMNNVGSMSRLGKTKHVKFTSIEPIKEQISPTQILLLQPVGSGIQNESLKSTQFAPVTLKQPVITSPRLPTTLHPAIISPIMPTLQPSKQFPNLATSQPGLKFSLPDTHNVIRREKLKRPLSSSLNFDTILPNRHVEHIPKGTLNRKPLNKRRSVLKWLNLYAQTDIDETTELNKIPLDKVVVEVDSDVMTKKISGRMDSHASDLIENIETLHKRHDEDNNTDNNLANLQYLKEVLKSENSLEEKEKEEIKKQGTGTDIPTENTETHVYDRTDYGPAVIQCLKELLSDESLHKHKEKIENQVEHNKTEIKSENIKSLSVAHSDEYYSDTAPATLQCLKNFLKVGASVDENEQVNMQSPDANIQTENIKTLPETHVDDDNTTNNYPKTSRCLKKLLEMERSLDEHEEEINKQSTNTLIPAENIETLPETRRDNSITDKGPATLECFKTLLEKYELLDKNKVEIEKQSTNILIAILQCFKELLENEDSLDTNGEEFEKQCGNTDIATENIGTWFGMHRDDNNIDNLANIQCLEDLLESEKSPDQNEGKIEKQTSEYDIPAENTECLSESYVDVNIADNIPVTLQCFKELLESQNSHGINKEETEKQRGNSYDPTEDIETLPDWHSADNYTDNNPADLQYLEKIPGSEKSLEENKEVIKKQITVTDIPTENIESLLHVDGNNTDNNLANQQCLEELQESEKPLHENKEIEKQSTQTDISVENIGSLPETYVDVNISDNDHVTLQCFKEFMGSQNSLDKNEETEKQRENCNFLTEDIETSSDSYGNDSYTNNSPAKCLEELTKSEKLLDENREEIEKQSTETDIPVENIKSLPEIHVDINITDNDSVALQCCKELLKNQDLLDKNKAETRNQRGNSDVLTEHIETLYKSQGQDNNTTNIPECLEEIPEIGKQSANADIPTTIIKTPAETHGDANDSTFESFIELLESEDSLDTNVGGIEKQSGNTNIGTRSGMHGDGNNIDNPANLCLEELLESEKSLDEKEETTKKQRGNSYNTTEDVETLSDRHGGANYIDYNPVTNLQLKALPECEKSLGENKKVIDKQSIDTHIPIENLRSRPDTPVDNNNTNNNPAKLQYLEELSNNEKAVDEIKEDILKQSTETYILTENIENQPETYVAVSVTDNDSVTLQCFKKLLDRQDSQDKNKKETEKQIGNSDVPTENIETLYKSHSQDNNTDNKPEYFEEQSANADIPPENIKTLRQIHVDDYLAALQSLKKMVERDGPLDQNGKEINIKISDADIPIESIKTLTETHGDANNIDKNLATSQCFKGLLGSEFWQDTNEEGVDKLSGNTDTPTEGIENLSKRHGDDNNTDSRKQQCLKELLEIVESSDSKYNKHEKVIEKQCTDTDIPKQDIVSLPEMYVDKYNTDNHPAVLQCVKELEGDGLLGTNIKGIENETRNTDIAAKNIGTLPDTDTHGDDDIINNLADLQCLEELLESEKKLDENEENIKTQTGKSYDPTEDVATLPDRHGADNYTDNNPAAILLCLEDLPKSEKFLDENKKEIIKQLNTDIPTGNKEILLERHSEDSSNDYVLATLLCSKELPESEELLDELQLKELTQEHQTVEIVKQKVGYCKTITNKFNTLAIVKNSPKCDDKIKNIKPQFLPTPTSHSYKFGTECRSLTKYVDINTNAIHEIQQENKDKNSVGQHCEQQENSDKEINTQQGNSDEQIDEQQWELDPKNETNKNDCVSITAVVDQVSTNKSNPKNNSNQKINAKSQLVNVEKERQLIVRQVRTEPSRLLFDDKQIHLIEGDKNEHVLSIPELKYNDEIQVSDAFKTVLDDHNYCKLKCFKSKETNEITQQTNQKINKRPRQFCQSNKRHRTKRMRLTEVTNNAADESLIPPNVIQKIIDMFELEANAIHDWDTSEPDNSGVQNLHANTSTIQEVFSFENNWVDPSSVLVSDSESDVDVDVENIQPQEKTHNYPISVTVNVEQYKPECVERSDEFDENYDWTVDRHKVSEYAEDNVKIDTETEKSNLDLSYEPNGTNLQNESNRCDNSTQSYKDYLNNPLEYHYANSPSENAEYSYDCVTNVDTNNQASGDFELNEINSFTVSLNSWSDIELADQQIDDPIHKQRNIYDTNFDEIRNLSPDLLEPIYYTKWTDQTYDHVSKNKESSKSKNKKQHKEVIKKKNCDDQFSNLLTKKRVGRKRKHEEAPKKATLDSEYFKTQRKRNSITFKSSKRLKKAQPQENNRSPLENNELPLETKESPPKNVEPIPEKYEKNLLEGINFEKLLLRPVVHLEKLKEIPRKTKINVNNAVLSGFHDKNKNVPQCPRLISQIGDLNLNCTITSDEINKDEASVSGDKILDKKLRTRPVSSSFTKKIQKRISANVFQKANEHMNIYTLRTLEDAEIKSFRRNIEKGSKFRRARYKCVKCVRIFPSPSNLTAHFKRYHELTSGLFKCKVCKSRFKNAALLKSHTDTHESCFKCLLCSCEYLYFRHFTDHFKEMHIRVYAQIKKNQPKRTYFKCQFCPRELLYQEWIRHCKKVHQHVMDDIVKQPQDKKIFACQTCGRQYSSRKTILDHQNNVRLGLPCMRSNSTLHKLSVTENNLSSTENNLSSTENNLSFNSLNIMKNNLSFTENNLSSTENNLSSTENNLSSTENNLSSTENNLSSTENNLSSTENNLSSTENNLSSTENNLSLTENNLCLTENNLSCTENKITLTGNKNTCADCNKNFRTYFAYKRHIKSAHANKDMKN